MGTSKVDGRLQINEQYILPDEAGVVGQSLRFPQTGDELEWFTAMGVAATLTQLMSGAVIWRGNLDFEVTPCMYYIVGNFYSITTSTLLTLEEADATNPRIDVIYVNDEGEVGVLTGTPAVDPAKPTVDFGTELELTSVLVNALATTPVGVTAEIVYDEDTEWTTSDNDRPNTTVDFANILSPAVNSKSIIVSKTGVGGITTTILSFNNNTTIDITDSTLAFYIKTSSPWISNKNWITFRFKYQDATLGNLLITNNSYGFNSSSSDWQAIAIPIKSVFPNYAGAFVIDEVEIVFGDWANNSTGVSVSFDEIQFQNGIEITPPVRTNLIEEICFEFRDITGTPGQVYILDLQAYYNYKVLGGTFQLDGGSATLSVKIANVEVTQLDSIVVTDIVSNVVALTNNTVDLGDTLSIILEGYTEIPTLLRGKIKYQRI